MPKTQALESIVSEQRAWAERHGIALDSKGRAAVLEDNLFQALSPDTKAEFEAGAGNELGGDMRSLRSSSALVANAFDPWRGLDLEPLHRALGGEGKPTKISFESKLPTGVRGTAPHLDVVLEGSVARVLGIESKFAEIYDQAHNKMQSAYVDRADLWEGASSSLKLARSLAESETTLERLGAAQLLKHALGLRRAYGPNGYRLVYLWYETPSREADVHRKEVAEFAATVEGEIAFKSLTYQELWTQLREIAADRPEYLGYLSIGTDSHETDGRFFQSSRLIGPPIQGLEERLHCARIR